MLTLTLFMACIAAHNIDLTFATDNFAMITNAFYAGSNFHDISLKKWKPISLPHKPYVLQGPLIAFLDLFCNSSTKNPNQYSSLWGICQNKWAIGG
jgi:hypothetical protein